MSGLDRFLRRDDSLRFLSREECAALVERIRGFAQGGGKTEVAVTSWWSGEVRWARNRVSLASDRRDIRVDVSRTLPAMTGDGNVTTNQLDDVSLTAAVRQAERSARRRKHFRTDIVTSAPDFQYAKPAIWSDTSYGVTTEERGRIARALLDPAEAAGMLSAGYLEVRAQGTASTPAEKPLMYAQQTTAQCSMTVRDPEGRGSGWAGGSSYDWTRIDPEALARRALEKCLASRNPVTIEPGRYTVILEPQAAHDLVVWVVDALNGRQAAENQPGPLNAGYDTALRLGRSKLGLKVVDERLTISHDPMDPALGVIPFADDGWGPYPVQAVTWIDHGVLTALSYGRGYAVRQLTENVPIAPRMAYRMSGGPTSVEEMIATTKRGLLVTRFSGVHPLSEGLFTGLTRDGLWLIENGKISKAVTNLRFTDSPWFLLNSLEQLGEPVPVFSPDAPAIVPPLKARDFSFTSAIDAI